MPLGRILSLSLLSDGLQKPQPLPVRVKVSLLTIRMSAAVGELGVKLSYDPSSAIQVLRLAGLSSQKEDCEMLKLPQTDT